MSLFYRQCVRYGCPMDSKNGAKLYTGVIAQLEITAKLRL